MISDCHFSIVISCFKGDIEISANENGIITKNNIDQPATLEGVVRDIDDDIFNILVDSFVNATRLNVTLFDEQSKQQLSFNNAIITSNPKNQVIEHLSMSLRISIYLYDSCMVQIDADAWMKKSEKYVISMRTNIYLDVFPSYHFYTIFDC